MAIDVKNIQDGACRVTKLSIAYLKNHPIIPAILAMLFLLYMFLPSLFVFLVFVLPVFIFIAVAFRLIFHIHQQNLTNAKGTFDGPIRKLTPSRGGRNLDKRGYSYAGAQSVRRRNSKKHELHVHFQENTDRKDTVLSSVNDNALVDKAVPVEETTKEIQEVEVQPMTDRSNCGFDDGSGLRANRLSSEKLGFEGENSDEDEEEAPGNGNKVVEWTEDDQKNLMDLGFSEMERNKRLESLIAKRKARKLLSLQVRRTLMNIGKTDPSSEIASILIPKTGAYSRTKSVEPRISPTPGSAPSVLLPVHNPFDLPYEPQEEKPNLTGGFQEELIDAHHNDAVFCRHESFSLGAFSPRPWELDQGLNETSQHPDFAIGPKIREIPKFSRFKNQSGKEKLGEITETETSEETETMLCTNSSRDPTRENKAPEKAFDLNDVNCGNGTNEVVDDPKSDTDDINLNGVHNGNGTNEVEDYSKLETDDIHQSISSSSSEINAPFSAANRNEILRSLSFSARKNIPVAELDTNAHTDGLSYHENTSPIEELRGNDPFFDNIHTRSQSLASDLQVEVSEVGSQITNLSWDGGSPKYDVGEDADVEEEGYSGNEEVWVASSQLKRVEENEARSGEVPEVSEQDIIEVGFSRINQEIDDPVSLESSQSHSGNIINKVHEEVEPLNVTYTSEILSTDDSALHRNKNQEEPSNSVENFAMDEKIDNDINDQLEHVNDDQGIIDFIQDTYGEDIKTMNQDLSVPTLNDGARAVDIIKESSMQPENDNSNIVESMEGERERKSEPEHIAEESGFTRNDNTVGKVKAENGPSKASSSTSPRSTIEDKDLSICLEKTTDGIELTNVVNEHEINILSNKGHDEQQGEHQSMVSNEHVGTSEFNPSLAQLTETVMFLGVDPSPIAVVPEGAVEQAALVSSTSSSPNSVLQRKFSVDLVSSMSLDNIDTASQQSNVEVEQNGNLPKDSIANRTHAGDSVGLQESLVPLSHANKENTNYGINDSTISEATGDELVQTCDYGADIGSLKGMEENEEIEAIKGVEATEEVQRLKGFESHSKLDSSINESTGDEIVQASDNRTNTGSTKPMEESEKIETTGGVKANEELQRSNELEGQSKLDNTISEGTRDGFVQTSDNQPDIGLTTPIEKGEKIETIEEVEANEELQRSKEIEGHSNLHKAIDNSESVGVMESYPRNSTVPEVNNDQNIRVAPKESG